jgi:hypothetical protein
MARRRWVGASAFIGSRHGHGAGRAKHWPLPARGGTEKYANRIKMDPFVREFGVRGRKQRRERVGERGPRPVAVATWLGSSPTPSSSAAAIAAALWRRQTSARISGGAEPAEGSDSKEPLPPPMAKPRSKRFAASWLRDLAVGAPSTTTIRRRPEWFALATTLKPAGQVKPDFIPSVPDSAQAGRYGWRCTGCRAEARRC